MAYLVEHILIESPEEFTTESEFINMSILTVFIMCQSDLDGHPCPYEDHNDLPH